MTFIPMIGFAVILCMPKGTENLMKWMAVAATTPPLLLAIWLYANFDRTVAGFQFVEKASWIPAANIEYHMGVDGISITMVLLTALLSFICIFASWGIDKGVKGYFSLFLLLDTGMMGVFCALDFFLFFVFGRSCCCRCTSSSACGAARAGCTPRSSSSSTRSSAAPSC